MNISSTKEYRRRKVREFQKRRAREIKLLRQAQADRKKIENDLFLEKIKTFVELTRTDGFRRWYAENYSDYWSEDFLRSQDSKSFISELLKSQSFQVLLVAFNESEEKIFSYLRNYTGEGKLVITAQEKRQDRIAKATPGWYDRNEVKSLQKQRDIYNKKYADDAPWHIDHIIPLAGELVCGLHVHTNMQLLPMSENCRKSNVFDTEKEED